MFLTTHAAAGIFLSHYIHNPTGLFAASFASHFVLDFIPHGDRNIYGQYLENGPHQYRRAVLVNIADLSMLTVLIMTAIGRPEAQSSNAMVIGILGAVLPDLLTHFFPILHQRLSWLWLVRWLYGFTKPSGLRYFVRAQNWFHHLFHHDIIHRDVSFEVGFSMQIILTAVFLTLAL